MKQPDPFDDILIKGEKFSIKKIHRLYERDTGLYPKVIEGVSNVWFCPSCNNFNEIPFKKPKFCSECGQRLKWPRVKKKNVGQK